MGGRDPAAVERELVLFEAGLRDPAGFGHREHVRLAYEMLGRHPFDAALARYAGGLRRMTARLGVPETYHATLTVAFLALVGERRVAAPDAGWDAFAAAQPDLFDPGCLRRWYDPARLASPAARATFVLPGPNDVAGEGAPSSHAGTAAILRCAQDDGTRRARDDGTRRAREDGRSAEPLSSLP